MFEPAIRVDNAQARGLITNVNVAVGLGCQLPDPGAQQALSIGRGKRIEMVAVKAVQAIRRSQPKPAIGRLRHARDMDWRAIDCGPGGVIVVRKTCAMTLRANCITQKESEQRPAQSLHPAHSRNRPIVMILEIL
jgi:hypothetical protein